MNTKFTKDGKKVVVIGNINKTEFIVQEIFVTEDGSEIPSGENFTSSSLFDEPCKSYKEKESERIEAKVKKLESERNALEKDIKEQKLKRQLCADVLKRADFAMKSLPNFDWDCFADFVCGNFKYAVDTRYGLKIEEFDSAIEDRWGRSYGGYKYEGIKSLSIWSNGCGSSSQFHIGAYRDQSGGSRQYEYFFKTDDELSSFLNQYIEDNKEKCSISLLEQASKFIEIDKDLMDKVVNSEIEKQKQSVKDQINSANTRLDSNLKDILEKKAKIIGKDLGKN